MNKTANERPVDSLAMVRWLLDQIHMLNQVIEDYPQGGYQRQLDIAETLLDLVEAAAPAAAPAPAQAEGWQPIETAPKDGTTIIAYEPGGTYPNGIAFPACVGTAYWRNADTLNPGMWCGPYNPRDYPTHWMPLPVPPSAPDAETP